MNIMPLGDEVYLCDVPKEIFESRDKLAEFESILEEQWGDHAYLLRAHEMDMIVIRGDENLIKYRFMFGGR